MSQLPAGAVSSDMRPRAHHDAQMREQTTHDPSIWHVPRLVGAVLGVAYGLFTFALGLEAAGEAGAFNELVFQALLNAVVGFIIGFIGAVILLTYVRVSKL
jgi:hypothetical protein